MLDPSKITSMNYFRSIGFAQSELMKFRGFTDDIDISVALKVCIDTKIADEVLDSGDYIELCKAFPHRMFVANVIALYHYGNTKRTSKFFSTAMKVIPQEIITQYAYLAISIISASDMISSESRLSIIANFANSAMK